MDGRSFTADMEAEIQNNPQEELAVAPSSSEETSPAEHNTPSEESEAEAPVGASGVEGEPEAPVSRASPALLQAVLLASGEPVSFVKIQEIMRCSRAELVDALQALREFCGGELSGVEIVTVGERLQLRTKVAFADAVRELLAVKPRKLSQAALETLSVVAYQQPIVKSEIDKIRGVDVAPTLKTLLERKIIKIIGYQASVGQPALYGTTEEFLRIFGLSSLGEMPALRDLKALAKEPGEVGEGADVDDAEEEAGDSEAAESVEAAASITAVANDDETSSGIPEKEETHVAPTESAALEGESGNNESEVANS